MEEIREKREEKENAQENELVIIDGAKIKFNAHMGSFKVLSDVPTTQDKLTATIVENQLTNFTFDDGFKLLSLGDWLDYGRMKVQDNEVLIKRSILPGTGQMPGSNSIETGVIEFVNSGQVNAPNSIDVKAAPVPKEDKKKECYCFNSGKVKAPCNGKGESISEDIYETEAELAGIDKAMMKAIAKQETKTKSFWKEGQATILFERHKMWKYLKIDAGKTDQERKKLQEKFPKIVNKSSGSYGKYSEQYEKLNKAKEIDYKSAIKSCSWGKFQVMGFNYAVAYASPEEMEIALNRCEIQHFIFFIGYLENTSGLINAMKNKEWKKIASLYNGSKWELYNPNYANNIKKYYNEYNN